MKIMWHHKIYGRCLCCFMTYSILVWHSLPAHVTNTGSLTTSLSSAQRSWCLRPRRTSFLTTRLGWDTWLPRAKIGQGIRQTRPFRKPCSLIMSRCGQRRKQHENVESRRRFRLVQTMLMPNTDEFRVCCIDMRFNPFAHCITCFPLISTVKLA